jgi:pyruvate kinase
VLAIREHDLLCKVRDGGTLGSRKHINLPGVRVNLPSITEKDKADIKFGIENDVDFIALSFVRNAEAVHQARQVLEEAGGHHARIISKIENQEGVDNFDAILAASDGIMVARGDLGVEVDYFELPVIQRMISAVSSSASGITRWRTSRPRRARPSPSHTRSPTWRCISRIAARATSG